MNIQVSCIILYPFKCEDLQRQLLPHSNFVYEDSQAWRPLQRPRATLLCTELPGGQPWGRRPLMLFHLPSNEAAALASHCGFSWFSSPRKCWVLQITATNKESQILTPYVRVNKSVNEVEGKAGLMCAQSGFCILPRNRLHRYMCIHGSEARGWLLFSWFKPVSVNYLYKPIIHHPTEARTNVQPARHWPFKAGFFSAPQSQPPMTQHCEGHNLIQP